jgi:hypothetical protein
MKVDTIHDFETLILPPPPGNAVVCIQPLTVAPLVPAIQIEVTTGRRLSQLCPRYATPSSNSPLDYRRSDARIVENGFATSGGVSKSGKVVLAFRASRRRIDCSEKRGVLARFGEKRPRKIANRILLVGAVRYRLTPIPKQAHWGANRLFAVIKYILCRRGRETNPH